MSAYAWMLASALVTLATAPLLGLFDSTAYVVAGDEATLSRLSQRTAWSCPLYQWSVCWLFAALCGHLFTTRPCEPPLPRWLALVLVVGVPYLVAVAVMLAGIRHPSALPLSGPRAGSSALILALVLGAVAGAELLHQTGD